MNCSLSLFFPHILCGSIIYWLSNTSYLQCAGMLMVSKNTMSMQNGVCHEFSCKVGMYCYYCYYLLFLEG